MEMSQDCSHSRRDTILIWHSCISAPVVVEHANQKKYFACIVNAMAKINLLHIDMVMGFVDYVYGTIERSVFTVLSMIDRRLGGKVKLF